MLTFAIGDVHGRLDLLKKAFEWIESRVGDQPFKVVTLGDYVDRGPESAGVLDFLIAKEAEGNTVCLRGNHEQMMMDACENTLSADFYHWQKHGGVQTAASYPSDSEGRALISKTHLDWMARLPFWHADTHRIYVHAGLRPGIPLAQQSLHDLMWIRYEFLHAIPAEMVDGKHVVHGHTPGYAAQRLDHRTNLDSYAYASGNLSVGVFKDDLAGGPVQVYVATV